MTGCTNLYYWQMVNPYWAKKVKEQAIHIFSGKNNEGATSSLFAQQIRISIVTTGTKSVTKYDTLDNRSSAFDSKNVIHFLTTFLPNWVGKVKVHVFNICLWVEVMLRAMIFP